MPVASLVEDVRVEDGAVASEMKRRFKSVAVPEIGGKFVVEIKGKTTWC